MIPHVLEKIRRDKARVVLCVPLWESKPWWTTFLDMCVKKITLSGCLWLDKWLKLMPAPQWMTCVAVVQG